MGMKVCCLRRVLTIGILCGLVSCIAYAGFSSVASASTTSASASARTYEMVTPAESKNIEVYVPLGLPPATVGNAGEVDTKLPFQVAANGEAVAYAGAPTVGGTGSTGYGGGNEYLTRRLPGGGWNPPDNVQPVGVASATYQAFSPDLIFGILQTGSEDEVERSQLSPLAPSGDYQVLYTRSMSDENYQPFFSVTPPNRGPSEFKAYSVPNGAFSNGLAYAGASASFRQLLFEANDALTTNAVDGGAQENNLYESIDGRVSLVNILPDGSTEADATFGAMPLNRPAENPPDFSNVISTDGSRVIWKDLNPGKENLYVSEDVGSTDEHTVQVDASQVPGGSGGGGRFWTASKDGSKVFFTDSDVARLTSDTQSGSGGNLYMYEVPTGKLLDLSVAADAEVQGVVGEGESEAGEYTVYFIAEGVLSENQNDEGAKAELGADNLYVLREGGQPIFVTVLSHEDGSRSIRPLSPGGSEEFGDWQPSLGRRTAEVTPNGQSLVFMSNDQRGPGNFVEVGGSDLEEVYVYEAETGSLFCASCSRDGVEPQLNLESEWDLGAYLPISWSDTYLPQWISDDGSRVFFDSDQPLVPSDTNGEQDVYEWERDGTGECTESTGCVYLLSGGTGATSSWLIGAGESGKDVLMISRTNLAPGVSDEAYSIYDARIGGAQPILSPTCTETGCQGLPSTPPTFATPASVTFDGVGDIQSSVKTKIVAKSVKKSQKRRKKSKTRKGRKARANRQRSRSHGTSGALRVGTGSHVSGDIR
jgi:hypothetical protein